MKSRLKPNKYITDGSSVVSQTKRVGLNMGKQESGK